MLSGNRPRGSSSVPVSGKIGNTSGKTRCAPEPGASLMSRLPTRSADPAASREHQRRQATPGTQGQRVGRTHHLEKLDELLAGGLLVPLAVALVEGQELV